MRAKSKALQQEWILLIHQLPPKPTNLRVRIWRKLQKLGAVAIKNSVYLLPANEKAHEDFQWLKQEIAAAGGEAAVFRAGSVEGATDAEIIAAFRKARDEEFAAIEADFDRLPSMLMSVARKPLAPRRVSPGRPPLSSQKAELSTLQSTRVGAGSHATICTSIGWPRPG